MTSDERDEAASDASGDLDGFGEFRRSAGPLPTIAAVLVAVVFGLGVLAWVFLR